MDTKDPRFISAYNELVNAFFRFINIVNPAPSRSDQIRLICDSMTSLVNMLQSVPVDLTEESVISGKEPSNVHEEASEEIQNNEKVFDSVKEDVPYIETNTSYSEKRYAKEPTLTADEVNKFLNKQLKKEDPRETDGDVDPDDYIFILEFDPETQKGIFYLNEDVNLSPVFSGSLEEEVVKMVGSPQAGDFEITSKGKIEKSTGGWEVVEPLVISKKG